MDFLSLKKHVMAYNALNLRALTLVFYRPVLQFKTLALFTLLYVGLTSCSNRTEDVAEPEAKTVAIFSINDPHGRIANFPKIKPILAAAKQAYDAVYFVSGGDLFSGNPIVDYHPEKGLPMIDFLNRLEMDISVLGNHEFDYGQEVLAHRITQANFPFICYNVSGGPDDLAAVPAYRVIEKNGVRIAFVGIVETGSPGGFPLTHPKKIQGLDFEDGIAAFGQFTNLKAETQADVLVALTHQGGSKDTELLNQHPFIDLIIGGHTNKVYGQSQAGGFMVQSGKYLETLGKTTFSINNGTLGHFTFQAIDLTANLPEDDVLTAKVEEYNNNPEFFEPIGTSAHNHSHIQTGCFYTNALLAEANSDLVIQNSGGIRAGLNAGTVTPFSIYSIDPFGNGLDTFEMTVGEIQTFMAAYRGSFAYAAHFEIQNNANSYSFMDADGETLPDSQVLRFTLNDYISNVYPDYFPEPTATFPLTTADYLIKYVRSQTAPLDHSTCFRWVND